MRKDNFKNLPEVLKTCGNWMLYKIETRRGSDKPTKVPYCVTTGRKADPTDSGNWSDFQTALAKLESDPSYAGLAFAISKGFVFVDYDKCRNPESGEIDKAVVQDVAAINSYTEVSPSGKGLHILCRSEAPLPPGGRRLNHFEIYDGKRYFTITGQHLEGTPHEVAIRTEELLSLHRKHFGSSGETKPRVAVMPIANASDEAILAACRAAKNAAKFSRLFDDGDTSEYGGDHSSADGALCALLAYRTRDGEQIDRLFRQSALFRPKWDEQRGTRTYGQITIDAALSLQKTLPPGFALTEDGVFYQSPGNGDDENTASMFVCSRLEIVGASRNAEGGDWSRILRWNDPEGRVHEWLMPMSMLAAEGNEIIAELLGRGLVISPTRKGRELLRTYIQTATTEKLETSVNRLGWHDHCFVLPDGTLGCKEEEQSLIFHSQSSVEHEFKVSGSLEEWQERISRYCVGNSRMLFAVSTAFAASVMRLVDAECGIIQLIGLSSTGKSTLLRIAASVNGSRKSVRNWRSTANGLEGTIALHNDLLLILDELGQANPKDVGEIVYLIGNGNGKIRATRNGGVRAVAQWLTLVLSSGELSLREHMASVGARTKGGQEVRCLDIPADAGMGQGAFEHLHNHSDAATFADALTQASSQVYGVAGRAFIAKIADHVEKTRSWLQQQIKLFIDEQYTKHGLRGASGEVYRALSRFALIGAAGELATNLLITGWRVGNAKQAAATCFAAWLSRRGGQNPSDVEAGIRKVKSFIELHGSSRFQEIRSFDDDKPPQKTFNRAGFYEKKADGSNVYYILPESFKDEVCVGYNADAVLKELKRQGHLQSDADRLTYKRTLPDFGKKGSYAILPSLFHEPDAPKRSNLSKILDEDAA